jgi:hypothetical protein
MSTNRRKKEDGQIQPESKLLVGTGLAQMRSRTTIRYRKVGCLTGVAVADEAILSILWRDFEALATYQYYKPVHKKNSQVLPGKLHMDPTCGRGVECDRVFTFPRQ